MIFYKKFLQNGKKSKIKQILIAKIKKIVKKKAFRLKNKIFLLISKVIAFRQ